MGTKVAALVGLLLMAAFVLYLAFAIGALPLVIIAVVVVAMAAVDVWESGLRDNGV